MTAPMEFPDRHGSLRASVEIAAPPETVFTALSNERELAAWLGGDATSPAERHPAITSSPAVAGQPWRVAALAPDGTRGSVEGEFLRVEPPYRIECTWRASWDGFAPDRVCFELTPIRIAGAPGTRLTVTHTRATAHLRVTAMAFASSESAWPTMLARLDAWAAARCAPSFRSTPPTIWYGDRHPGWTSQRIPFGATR